jgi:hypothetical protein
VGKPVVEEMKMAKKKSLKKPKKIAKTKSLSISRFAR